MRQGPHHRSPKINQHDFVVPDDLIQSIVCCFYCCHKIVPPCDFIYQYPYRYNKSFLPFCQCQIDKRTATKRSVHLGIEEKLK